jgi:phosphatidate cytidylyltransferase
MHSNLTLRILTGVIGGPIVIALIMLSWWTTALLIVVALALATIEYSQLVQHEPSSARNDILFGLFYLGTPLVAALWLRGQDNGEKWFLIMLIANWVTDSAAYFTGRFIGKTPFAPTISPKKTWEGVIGGLVFGFILTLVGAAILGLDIGAAAVAIGIFVPIATVLGDLLESKLKRHFNVKDSGKLLPGHGGILDRIDGTLMALPAAAIVVALLV